MQSPLLTAISSGKNATHTVCDDQASIGGVSMLHLNGFFQQRIYSTVQKYENEVYEAKTVCTILLSLKVNI